MCRMPGQVAAWRPACLRHAAPGQDLYNCVRVSLPPVYEERAKVKYDNANVVRSRQAAGVVSTSPASPDAYIGGPEPHSHCPSSLERGASDAGRAPCANCTG